MKKIKVRGETLRAKNLSAEILLNSAEQAFNDGDYKRAFSCINKYNRSKIEPNYQSLLLEIKILNALGKYNKSLIALSSAIKLAVDNKDKRDIHNLFVDAYNYLYNIEKMIDHLEQSITYDSDISNAAARFRLLNLYVGQERLTQAKKIGNRLLSWQDYYSKTAFLLLKVSKFKKDKNSVIKYAKLLISHASFICDEDNLEIFNNLISVDALSEAALLVEERLNAHSSYKGYKNAKAIIYLKQGKIKEAIAFFSNEKGNDDVSAVYFYQALKQYYFNIKQLNTFLNLQEKFTDDYFTMECIEEYVSFGKLDLAVSAQLNLQHTDFLKCTVDYNKLIAYWILGDITKCRLILNDNVEFIKKTTIEKSLQVPQVFMRYIKALIGQHKKSLLPSTDDNTDKLYVIGESHSLVLNNKTISLDNCHYKTEVKFIKGIKMHHLSDGANNKYKYYFQKHVKGIEKNANLFFIVGEIDCRIEDGISKAARNLNSSIENIVKNTVSTYIAYLKGLLLTICPKQVFIQGVPAPFIPKNTWLDIPRHIQIIKQVNEELRQESLKNKWFFIDVYCATVDINGWSHGKWHLDYFHLKPSIYDNISKWLIHK